MTIDMKGIHTPNPAAGNHVIAVFLVVKRLIWPHVQPAILNALLACMVFVVLI